MILVTVEITTLGGLINDFLYRERKYLNQKILADKIGLTESELSTKKTNENWNYVDPINVKRFIIDYYKDNDRVCPYVGLGHIKFNLKP